MPESEFNAVSYIMGYESGKTEGTKQVVIEEGITCTDDGNANITITAGGN